MPDDLSGTILPIGTLVVPTGLPGGGGGSAPGGDATVSVGAKPLSPTPGALWWDDITAKLFLWSGSEWIIVVNTPGGGAVSAQKEIIFSDTAPSNPASGDLWFDTINNALFAWNGSNWVPSAPPTEGYLPLRGGIVSGGVRFTQTVGILGTLFAAGGADFPGGVTASTAVIGGAHFLSGGNMQIAGGITPGTDNWYGLGGPGTAWHWVYSYSFVDLSSESLKTDISRMAPDHHPEVLGQISALPASSYRWRASEGARMVA